MSFCTPKLDVFFLKCTFLLLDSRKSIDTSLYTSRFFFLGLIKLTSFTNVVELTSSIQKQRHLQSNARMMLTETYDAADTCRKDKDAYLADQWHLFLLQNRKLTWYKSVRNFSANKSSVQTVSSTAAISLNCLTKFWKGRVKINFSCTKKSLTCCSN